MLELIDHLIHTNTNRAWNVLENEHFIVILIYVYMHVMKDRVAMHSFFDELYTLNPRNIKFREKLIYITLASLLIHAEF